MKIVGIDLAGKPENPTGFCVLDDQKFIFRVVYKDEEILKKIDEIDPSLVAVDAPLSLPKGRCCLRKNCSCRKIGGDFRAADIEMRKYGRVLPLSFHGMRMLTERGIKLAAKLKKHDIIEVHPRTTQRILGFENLYHDLGRYFKLPKKVTDHELDAALAAITGLFCTRNRFIEVGDPQEGTIILPKNKKDFKMLFGP